MNLNSASEDHVKDLLDLLGLAVGRTNDKLKQLDDQKLNSSEQKELIDEIAKLILKANQNVSNIQYEIKSMQKNDNRSKEYTAQLNQLRTTVNDYELSFNAKKKKLKYEIRLNEN